MAMLIGRVISMRVVSGEVEEGSPEGEECQFLFMEIVDRCCGKVYFCQVSNKDVCY